MTGTADLRHRPVSANLRALVGRDAASVLGEHFGSLITDATLERLQRWSLEGIGSSTRYLGADTLGSSTQFELIIHQHDGVLLLEAESVAMNQTASLQRIELLRESLDRAEHATGIEMLATQLTDDVRAQRLRPGDVLPLRERRER